MNFWRVMAAHGGGYDFATMNVASSSPVIPSRADGEEPRKHIWPVGISKKDPIADARSLSALRRIGMTTAFLAE